MKSSDMLKLIILMVALVSLAAAQCPWQRDVAELQASCICAYNLGRELSVQCDQVDFLLLLEGLNKYAQRIPIDLLYVNNSTIGELDGDIFADVRLQNVQLSSCKIKRIADDAFKGQEKVLKNVNLQDNLLTELPARAFKRLKVLNLLDLTKNRIRHIPDGAFEGLTTLSTLKLNENNVTLAAGAFRGLENSLKNLNLKGTRQRRVPESIRGLRSLAFLDLSLNGIKELPGIGGRRTFEGLDSLTALNLERNLIQHLGESAFDSVRKTLSSLSLLNNLLAEFPIGALHSLKELRVLDIGFNLLTTLPEAAFRGNPSITLLALDGNPLATVPHKAVAHLNATLRGLSLGGRALHCDCKLKWVAEWIRDGDLQVTSRERNPQFCGSPQRFQDRGFYSIRPEELTCSGSDKEELKSRQRIPAVSTATPSDNSTTPISLETPSVGDDAVDKSSSIESSEESPTTERVSVSSTTEIPASSTRVTGATGVTGVSTTKTPPTPNSSTSSSSLSSTTITNIATDTVSNISIATTPSQTNSKQTLPTQRWRPPTKQQQRPPLVLGFPQQRGDGGARAEVRVKNAYRRQDGSVVIQWTTDSRPTLGHRVVYRLFGEKSFKQGPPLEVSEREFRIKNVPGDQCIVVCVITLDELHVTVDTVPYRQCREVRSVPGHATKMDKITIAASAAICGTIIVAMIVFVAANRRSSKSQNSPSHKGPLPIGRMPMNCCGPNSGCGPASLGPMPMPSLGLGPFNNNRKDWDQVSTYSGRSIPKAHGYSYAMTTAGGGDASEADDMRSRYSGVPAKPRRSSVASGQSQAAGGFGGGLSSLHVPSPTNAPGGSTTTSNQRDYLSSVFPSNLINSRPELRQSRQSLATALERLSRASYAGSIQGGASIASSSRLSQPRSRSREQLHMNSSSIRDYRGEHW